MYPEDEFGHHIPQESTFLNSSPGNSSPVKPSIAWPSASKTGKPAKNVYAHSNYPSTQASWANENKSPNLKFQTMPAGSAPQAYPSFGSRIPQKQTF
mmetsp:Transcript_11742/g.17991  ORF Transcript_11742/g.17991 Transcript_11742/m.17991 type:complete len:97 (+) Transcript_11742:1390-1680(+)